MSLTNDQVKKIAYLARLGLTDGEIEKFTGQLSSILEHVEMLKEVDTENVEPIAQITGLTNITFKDEVVQCEIADALLEESPQDIQDHMIKVKSVFD